MSELTLYGHNVLSIMRDFLLVFVAYGMLWASIWEGKKSKNKKRHKWVQLPLYVLYVLFLPNALYLVTEFRHFILKDHVADSQGSAITFTIISLAGFYLMVKIFLLDISKGPYLKNYLRIKTSILAFLSSFGTALGIRRVNSSDVFFKPEEVLQNTAEILNSGMELWIILFTTILIAVTVILINKRWVRN